MKLSWLSLVIWKERAVQGKKVTGSLSRIMKGTSVSKEVRKGVRDNIVYPTLTYAAETLNELEVKKTDCGKELFKRSMWYY